MARLGHVLLALGCMALALGTFATPTVAQVAEGQAVPPGAHRTLQEAVASAVAQAPPRQAASEAQSAVVWGAVVGAGVGAGVAVVYAAAYGHNEGGGLCVGCLATWGLALTGAGAAIGAGVGAAIGAAAPSRQPGAWQPAGARPPGPPRAAAFTVRF